MNSEDIRGAMALVLVINPRWIAGAGRSGRPGLLEQLYGLLIHTNQGNGWIIGQAIGIQDCFHPRDKLTVLFGGNHPGLTQMRLQFVFLSTSPTKECETCSHRPLSTAFSANKRNDQRA